MHLTSLDAQDVPLSVNICSPDELAFICVEDEHHDGKQRFEIFASLLDSDPLEAILPARPHLEEAVPIFISSHWTT